MEKIVVYENGKIIVYFRFEDNWGWDENGCWWWGDTDTLGERGWINGTDQIKSDNAHPHNSPDYDWNVTWQVKTSNAMVTAFSYKISNNLAHLQQVWNKMRFTNEGNLLKSRSNRICFFLIIQLITKTLMI